ncbi:hypothetical protein pb186bvf_013092 [Paramecium bursaria]
MNIYCNNKIYYVIAQSQENSIDRSLSLQKYLGFDKVMQIMLTSQMDPQFVHFQHWSCLFYLFLTTRDRKWIRAYIRIMQNRCSVRFRLQEIYSIAQRNNDHSNKSRDYQLYQKSLKLMNSQFSNTLLKIKQIRGFNEDKQQVQFNEENMKKINNFRKLIVNYLFIHFIYFIPLSALALNVFLIGQGFPYFQKQFSKLIDKAGSVYLGGLNLKDSYDFYQTYLTLLNAFQIKDPTRRWHIFLNLEVNWAMEDSRQMEKENQIIQRTNQSSLK